MVNSSMQTQHARSPIPESLPVLFLCSLDSFKIQLSFRVFCHYQLTNEGLNIKVQA